MCAKCFCCNFSLFWMCVAMEGRRMQSSCWWNGREFSIVLFLEGTLRQQMLPVVPTMIRRTISAFQCATGVFSLRSLEFFKGNFPSSQNYLEPKSTMSEINSLLLVITCFEPFWLMNLLWNLTVAFEVENRIRLSQASVCDKKTRWCDFLAGTKFLIQWYKILSMQAAYMLSSQRSWQADEKMRISGTSSGNRGKECLFARLHEEGEHCDLFSFFSLVSSFHAILIRAAGWPLIRK